MANSKHPATRQAASSAVSGAGGATRPGLCNPRFFPAMQALNICCSSRPDEQKLAEFRLESELRIGNLLGAEWIPSTNKSFELLTGKTGRYTYYLYSRSDKLVCEDLYGAFCAVFEEGAEATRKTSEMTAFIPLYKVIQCNESGIFFSSLLIHFCRTSPCTLGTLPHSSRKRRIF